MRDGATANSVGRLMLLIMIASILFPLYLRTFAQPVTDVTDKLLFTNSVYIL